MVAEGSVGVRPGVGGVEVLRSDRRKTGGGAEVLEGSGVEVGRASGGVGI